MNATKKQLMIAGIAAVLDRAQVNVVSPKLKDLDDNELEILAARCRRWLRLIIHRQNAQTPPKPDQRLKWLITLALAVGLAVASIATSEGLAWLLCYH